MDYYISTIAMEVTRRCNGGKVGCDGIRHACAHCLRGNPQPINMSDEIIEAVAKSQLGAGTILFTGGEPTLVPGIVQKIITNFNNHRFNYESFYMVTNGVRYSPKTVSILNDLYNQLTTGIYDDGLCGLAMSIDQFHEFNSVSYYKYSELPYYKGDKEYRKGLVGIINEGLAKEHGLAVRENCITPEVEVDSNDGSVYFELVYINAKGEVVLNCDLSYETQSKLSIGNVLQAPLKEILDNYVKNNLKDELALVSA